MFWLAAALPLFLLPLGNIAWSTPQSGSEAACLSSIKSVEEAAYDLPDGLLRAIALVESGRRVGKARAAVPWPWTINSPSGSFYLDTQDQAVAKVHELRRTGIRNIDVGCMQINLLHHPHAFNSLADAFTPSRNVAYAAKFLRSLKTEAPTLFRAVAHYHSRTERHGLPYAHRVYRAWGRAAPPSSIGERVTTSGPRTYRAGAGSWQVRDAAGSWRRAPSRPNGGTTSGPKTVRAGRG